MFYVLIAIFSRRPHYELKRFFVVIIIVRSIGRTASGTSVRDFENKKLKRRDTNSFQVNVTKF